jgi:hypothetical protein
MVKQFRECLTGMYACIRNGEDIKELKLPPTAVV